MTTTKSRIMFVDDDPMLLASTRRQLLPKLHDYELVFCSGGRMALEQAAFDPPAIVFSDVRMPEMDGPELLKEFSISYPDTIRFALTGQSHEEQFDRTCSVAHQIFSKPFETEKIRTIIENLMLLRQSFEGAKIHSGLNKPLADFPDLGNISEILHQLNSPEMSIEKVANVVEQDFTTKAHLLSIANSSFVAPVHPIASTSQAIMLLGTSMVKAIYLTVQANRIADGRACAKHALQSCLDYGLKLSFTIQKLARKRNMDPDLRECAIMSGMLQKFGRILFTLHGDDDYCELGYQLQDKEEELVAIESELFHVPHEIAGAYVLLLWGMDPRVCMAIAKIPSASEEIVALQSLLREGIEQLNNE